MKRASFRKLVDRFAESPSDDGMKQIVDHVQRYGLSDEEIAHLALRLAESGEMLRLAPTAVTADIASTGGPTSLSTLLCPLYLRTLGYTVPKVGMPGRPAGGVDVLAQIPSYRIRFTASEVETLLKESSYVHLLASDSFAPLDAALFSFRQRSNTLNIPDLAIASLLAKKKAVGVSLVGLDVRVAPYGNFGPSFLTASRNAARFCRVASLLGSHARCFLTDATRPYQPFIGRGESLIALFQVLNNKSEPWLRKHEEMCYAMAYRLSLLQPLKDPVRPDFRDVRSAFIENLEVQGSSYAEFEKHVSEILDSHSQYIRASRDGFLDVDLAALRSAMVRLQKSTLTPDTPFPDPCGIILKRECGAYVTKGEVLATLRCVDASAREMVKDVTASLCITSEPVSRLYFEEIDNG